MSDEAALPVKLRSHARWLQHVALVEAAGDTSEATRKKVRLELEISGAPSGIISYLTHLSADSKAVRHQGTLAARATRLY